MRDFLEDLETEFGNLIRSSDEFCKELWSALTNTDWNGPDGNPAYNLFGVSFRAAGGIIADIRGSGNYMHWYCESPSGIVSKRISDGMAKYGWSHTQLR